MNDGPDPWLVRAMFRWRGPLFVFFAVLTLTLAAQTVRLRIDAGFEKRLPLDHPYMETFLEHRAAFGGADRLLIAIRAREGSIFTPHVFEVLRQVTDAVFFLPGVDRSSVRSLFTPNVRFVEVVENGFVGGNVVPAHFRSTTEGLAEVRANVLKAGIVGRLVADDFSAAIVSARLLEHDSTTDAPIDHLEIAGRLETLIRQPFVDDRVDIHIVGFAKAIGDVADGARGVLGFLGITVALTAVVIYAFTRSLRSTLLALGCSGLAVVWALGSLALVGFAIDPMSILLPFLVFAIGVSHGVQLINAFGLDIAGGATREEAARRGLTKVLTPGAVAVASDAVGFLTILTIAVPMVRELAITMALAMAFLGLTNLVLLPLALSLVGTPTSPPGVPTMNGLWRLLATLTRPRRATLAVLAALMIMSICIDQARHVQIGDLRPGVPELSPDSRYNRDARFVAEHFAIGVDLLQVIAEVPPDGCVDYRIMSEIDRFQWHMANVAGVRSTLSLPQLAKRINAGWYEGSLKWQVLPRDPAGLAAAIAPIETSSGLLDGDCSVLPVMIFTEDHEASTISRVVQAAETYQPSDVLEGVRLRLATGNLAVMAATNQVVAKAQFPMLLYVYGAVALFCLIGFRSLAATLCVLLPLILVSVMVYALMYWLDIGLGLSTLPVAALVVAIGVDYGIYLFRHLQSALAQGLSLEDAYRTALQGAGGAILVTASTLAIGVAGWVFSDLQFQADMGLLLAFGFLANMIAALVLIPALAGLILRGDSPQLRHQ